MAGKCRVVISTVLTQNGANYDGDGSEPFALAFYFFSLLVMHQTCKQALD